MHGWFKGLVIIALALLVAFGFATFITASDSDLGDEPQKAGVCRDSWDNKDVCLAGTLLEFYPDGPVCKYKFYNCQKAFPNTACKNDSDGSGYCG